MGKYGYIVNMGVQPDEYDRGYNIRVSTDDAKFIALLMNCDYLKMTSDDIDDMIIEFIDNAMYSIGTSKGVI